jgi:hypothetical protein
MSEAGEYVTACGSFYCVDRPEPAPHNGPCAAAIAAQGTATLGAFVPQCDADGTFSALQCDGSTGACWCARDDGTELTGTRVVPSGGGGGYDEPTITSTQCQGLRSVVSTCLGAGFNAEMALIDSICCPDGKCTGMPSSCSSPCAGVFLPWWDSCAETPALKQAQRELSSFAQLCTTTQGH